jgi:hypothetical protein
VPTPLFSMVRRRKPIASWLVAAAGSTCPNALSTEDRVDMVLVLVMSKEGHSDIETPIFYLRLTAQPYTT